MLVNSSNSFQSKSILTAKPNKVNQKPSFKGIYRLSFANKIEKNFLRLGFCPNSIKFLQTKQLLNNFNFEKFVEDAGNFVKNLMIKEDEDRGIITNPFGYLNTIICEEIIGISSKDCFDFIQFSNKIPDNIKKAMKNKENLTGNVKYSVKGDLELQIRSFLLSKGKTPKNMNIIHVKNPPMLTDKKYLK